MSIKISDKQIGDGHPCFVIAEVGVNHNGSLDLAKQLVAAAATAGADAVKFQTFRADAVISASAPKAQYQKETTGPAEQQLEMVRRLEMPEHMTRSVAAYAATLGITFLSTGFDEQSIDLLDDIGVPAFKIGSGDVTDLPLLEFVGRKQKPVILSTGMSYLDEVGSAGATLLAAGCPDLALLHCVSSYPADPQEANLRVLRTLRDTFNVPVGLSDHFLDNVIALAAVAVGASIVEKHITLDVNLPGPDHRISQSPEGFKQLVQSIRTVERSLGDGVKRPHPGEQNVRDLARRSIVAACSIAEGATITREMLTFKRPGTGIAPAQWKELVGKRAVRDIAFDSLIMMGDLA
jgi:N-acetylneuraminate synthase/N,N'-diacetyllegionaminate synthase